MEHERDNPAGEGPRASDGTGAARARVKVVFVEDLAPLRRLVVSALGYEGIDVRGAGTLGEGLAAVEASEVDVLVTDLYLPDGTGRELVLRARKVRPGLKAMCVSGSPQSDPVFDCVIEKPFDVEVLATEIRALAAR